MDDWRVGVTMLREQLPEDVQAVLDKAEETNDFTSPKYEAAVEVFYKRHLSLARPWPAPEVQSALGWFAADATKFPQFPAGSYLCCRNTMSSDTTLVTSAP